MSIVNERKNLSAIHAYKPIYNSITIHYIRDMIYMITVLIIIIILTLLLKLRLKLQLEDATKIAFFGLGRSGISYDFNLHQMTLFLFGKKIKELSTQTKTEKKTEVKKTSQEPNKEKPKRVRPLKDILALIPKSSKALYTYSISILKSIVVEELEGQVTAGFDSPDITGQFFGYYQAAYYAVPSVVGRVQYQPNWTEASFDANLRASVAIPLYKIMYRSIILFFSLPLRDIIKITIGRKERSHDG